MSYREAFEKWANSEGTPDELLKVAKDHPGLDDGEYLYPQTRLEFAAFVAGTHNCKQGEEYWLYEIEAGKGIFQGCTGDDAEKVITETANAFENSGKPFKLSTHAMPKSDDDPYRAKAVEILELDMEEFGDDKAINLTGLYKLLCGDDGYLAIPNEKYFSVIESAPQP